MSSAYAQGEMRQHIYTEEDYYRIPDKFRAELIEGQIYYQAAPSRLHQEISGFLYASIFNYIRAKSGVCRVYHAPFAVKLFNDRNTIVEPDISIVCDLGKLTPKGCSGAPDWIIEIVSMSNPGNDYVRKLNLYADAGVKEYWIVDPYGETVFVYNLAEGKFRATEYSFADEIKVLIYDGLSISLEEFKDGSHGNVATIDELF